MEEDRGETSLAYMAIHCTIIGNCGVSGFRCRRGAGLWREGGTATVKAGGCGANHITNLHGCVARHPYQDTYLNASTYGDARADTHADFYVYTYTDVDVHANTHTYAQNFQS